MVQIEKKVKLNKLLRATYISSYVTMNYRSQFEKCSSSDLELIVTKIDNDRYIELRDTPEETRDATELVRDCVVGILISRGEYDLSKLRIILK